MEYEIAYWSLIQGDHCRFIVDSLGKNEILQLEIFKDLQNAFDSDQSLENMQSLASDMFKALSNLLNEMSLKSVKIALSSSFIVHLIGETEQMISILSGNEQDLNYAELCTVDSREHLLFTIGDMDPIFDSDTVRKLKKLEKKVNCLIDATRKVSYINVDNNYSFLLNEHIFHHCSEVLTMFANLRLKCMDATILGRVTVLALDHMYREECYYLGKLGLKVPNPTLGRIEE